MRENKPYPGRRLRSWICGMMVLSMAACATTYGAAAGAEEAKAALARGTDYLTSISTEGGYLWRYSADMKFRAGENVATPTQIWVQPPGTPSVGGLFLRAYAATGDGRHLAAARAAAMSLVRGQLESGGWDYLVEFDPAKRKTYAYRADGGPVGTRKNLSTYDDDNTQSALRFLMAFVAAAKKAPTPEDARIQEALEYGLKKLMEAQYPVGAWPQRWDGKPRDTALYPVIPASYPEAYERNQPKASYYGHYTLNDNTHRDATLTLFEAHRRTGRAEYLAAARKAADFLLLAQMPEPQPIWAQQYDAKMQPAWARAFEPPSVTAAESANVMTLLVRVYRMTGDAKYLKPLPAAVAWYRRSELAPGRWARLNELKTNRPLYGDRDGCIHYTIEEISEERQRGYSWVGDYGINAAIAVAEKALAEAGAGKPALPQAEREVRGRKQKRPGGPFGREGGDLQTILSEQDAQGRWLTDRGSKVTKDAKGPWVATDHFIERMSRLCEYLETGR